MYIHTQTMVTQTPISVRMDSELLECLNILSCTSYYPKNRMINRAVAQYLKNCHNIANPAEWLSHNRE